MISIADQRTRRGDRVRAHNRYTAVFIVVLMVVFIRGIVPVMVRSQIWPPGIRVCRILALLCCSVLIWTSWSLVWTLAWLELQDGVSLLKRINEQGCFASALQETANPVCRTRRPGPGLAYCLLEHPRSGFPEQTWFHPGPNILNEINSRGCSASRLTRWPAGSYHFRFQNSLDFGYG